MQKNESYDSDHVHVTSLFYIHIYDTRRYDTKMIDIPFYRM